MPILLSLKNKRRFLVPQKKERKRKGTCLFFFKFFMQASMQNLDFDQCSLSGGGTTG